MVRKGAVTTDQCKGRRRNASLKSWMGLDLEVTWGNYTRLCGETALAFEKAEMGGWCKKMFIWRFWSWIEIETIQQNFQKGFVKSNIQRLFSCILLSLLKIVQLLWISYHLNSTSFDIWITILHPDGITSLNSDSIKNSVLNGAPLYKKKLHVNWICW